VTKISGSDSRDTLFDHSGEIEDFKFDASVSHVFDDMVRRSVPGYQEMLDGIRAFAPTFVKPHTNVYDLGCSLGSASLAILESADDPTLSLYAVDLSKPMLEHAASRMAAYKRQASVEVREQDISQTPMVNASFVVLNLTLQFVEPDSVELALRTELIRKIYGALIPGGALLVSEKVRFDQPLIQDFLDVQQMDFKRRQGYSDLEIAQKRNALENVMKLDTIPQHLRRFEAAGFEAASLWYQNLNFCSFIAIKSA